MSEDNKWNPNRPSSGPSDPTNISDPLTSANASPSELRKLDTVDGEPSVLLTRTKQVPQFLGHYEIIEELGTGGMGMVFKAYDASLKRYAALKLIRAETSELALRFVQEARAQARVQHENVCKVYEVGEAEGKQYIAMQLIEGQTLSSASKKMPLEAKIQVIEQVANALHSAHRQGLIHRDVKPSNIMLELTEEGIWKPYVLDFGLARDQEGPGITSTGVALGTPFYMAPEQVSGQRDQLDRRTDVYGLGATLYELLSGKPPYQGESTPVILMRILSDDPVRLSKLEPKIPQDLETIVMKCLEREPARRYDSAKALAEDLRRFLNGDPVTAKPLSWSYRLRKKARKNRLATAIAVSGVVITLILAASLLLIQWQGALQSKYAREFGDEVRNIQSVLPNVYSAPIHDVRPEISELRRRLTKMEERVKQGGRAAQDPGNNALGQGYLSLGEIEKAKEYLLKAWNSGYQLPSTAYALGQTMGLLYQRKLSEADRIPNEVIREKKKQEYEKEFRDPAVAYLKMAEGNVESPAYVEGLIALYEKRYDEALKKAKEASLKSQSSYEAKKLEGDALMGKAELRRVEGDFKGAIEQYATAGEAYLRAADLGRSRADIYLSDCERWGTWIHTQTYTDVSPTPFLQKAEEACDKALQVNRDDPGIYLAKAQAYAKLANYQMYNSPEDPRILAKKSIESARIAVNLNPKDSEPHSMMCYAYQLSGEYELRHGMDPQKSLREAIAQCEQGLRVNENSPSNVMRLGLTYTLLGEYESQNGRNPIPAFQKAIEQYQKSEELLPNPVVVGNNAGIAYAFMAYYRLNNGEDPTGDYQNSINQYNRVLQVTPNDPYANYNLGCVFLDRSDYEMAVGENPTFGIEQSLEKLQKANQFIPNNSYVYTAIANAYLKKAKFLLSQKKDPAEAIVSGRKYCEQAIQIDAKYYQPVTNLGEMESLNGQWAIENGLSPVRYFDSARTALQKSMKLNPEESATPALIADAYRREAEWELQNKKPAQESIAKGHEFVEKSLKLNPKNAFAIATQGVLFLLQARNSTSDSRLRFASSGSAALGKAIQLSPLLRHDFESFLKEANEYTTLTKK